MTWAAVILAVVTLQRIFELLLAQRNTQRLLDRGGGEVAAEHYPLIVLLHTLWLAALWWWGWNASVNTIWLSLFVVLQVLRIWIIATLGDRWTTRIITVPGETRIRIGPYRFMNHPNYAVVIAEIAVLPLTLGLLTLAIVFSALNAIVMFVRIKAETQALNDAET